MKILFLALFLSGCCTCNQELDKSVNELSSRLGELERWIMENADRE